MKPTIIGLTLFLLTASVQAGTLTDNFEDGNFEGWQELFTRKPVVSVWKVQNGVLIGKRDSAWGADLVIGDAVTWRDYTIECDVRVIERIPNEFGGDFHYAGVMGRVQPENKVERDSIGIVLNLKVVPTIWEFVFVNNGQFLHNVQKPFNAKLSTWYHLKSVMEGDTFKSYVDGTLVSSFNSKAIATGQVGITIGGCVVEFDNLRITGNDIPDKNLGLSVDSKAKLATTWATIKQSR